MEGIKLQFISNPKHDEDTAREPQCQAGKVDDCKILVAPEVSECDQDEIADHRQRVWCLTGPTNCASHAQLLIAIKFNYLFYSSVVDSDSFWSNSGLIQRCSPCVLRVALLLVLRGKMHSLTTEDTEAYTGNTEKFSENLVHSKTALHHNQKFWFLRA